MAAMPASTPQESVERGTVTGLEGRKATVTLTDRQGTVTASIPMTLRSAVGKGSLVWVEKLSTERNWVITGLQQPGPV